MQDVMSQILDYVFPSRPSQRRAAERYLQLAESRLEQKRLDIKIASAQLEHDNELRAEKRRRAKMATDLMEAEMHAPGSGHASTRRVETMPTYEGYKQSGGLSGRMRLSEDTSSAFYGNPWQVDASGLYLDQAWRLGFPTTDSSFFYANEETIAHDDSSRIQVLRLARHLYTQHPHAKAMVNACVNFVVGPKAWTVDPTPTKPDFDDDNSVQPVQEDLYQGDAGVVDPVGGIIAPVSDDPERDAETDDPFAPSDPIEITSTPDSGLQRKLRKLWAKYVKRGKVHPQLGWKQVWAEAFLRTRRDGECFIHLGNAQDDGRLTPRFIDPLDIQHPKGLSGYSGDGLGVFDPDANGIKVDADDPSTILGYWFRRQSRMDVPPEFIPAERMIHIKFGVDSTTRRGLPMLFVCRNFLKHFDTWITQSLKHQKCQTMLAVLRQWEDSTEALLTTERDSTAVRSYQRVTPAGNALTYATQDQLPVVDAPAGMKLTYTSPNGGFGDSEILARRVLLACAAGINLSEAMVTADGSNANYASTRITQFIPLRAFEGDQGDWAETIVQFYEKWVYAEVAAGRVPTVNDDCQLGVTVTPSRLPDFEGEVATAMIVLQLTNNIIDMVTAREMLGHDNDKIEQRLKSEEHKLGAQSATAKAKLTGQAGVAPPGNDDQQLPGEEKPGNVPDDQPVEHVAHTVAKVGESYGYAYSPKNGFSKKSFVRNGTGALANGIH